MWPRLLLAFSLSCVACDPPTDSSAVVEVKLGNGVTKHFTAVTSLAQYLEVPGSGNELRLTIANYEVPCDVFEPPGPEQISVSVVITTPAGVKPTPGVYPWLGHEAHGGEAHNPTKPYAFPSVRIGDRSTIFHPGGGAALKGLSLSKHGSVSGLLNFEFPGNAKHPASSLKGKFSSRICRYSGSDSG